MVNPGPIVSQLLYVYFYLLLYCLFGLRQLYFHDAVPEARVLIFQKIFIYRKSALS